MSRRKTYITAEGIIYLIVLAFIVGGAVIREINLLMFVAGILIGPVVISWRLVRRSLDGLKINRHLPNSLVAGEMLVVNVDITKELGKAPGWSLNCRDQIVREDATGYGYLRTAPIFCPYLEPAQSKQMTYQGRVAERGRYLFGPMEITTRFPLGLMERIVTLDKQDKLVVYPRLGMLSPQWFSSITASRSGGQKSRNRSGLSEGEFHSLRGWRSGDSRNRIHWRTTARRNELTVRQFEHCQNQDLAIVLDLRCPAGLPCTDTTKIERAIRFAATVVVSQCRKGSSQLLLAIGGKSPKIMDGVTSSGFVHEAMETLAVAVPYHRDHLPSLLDQVTDQVDPLARIVIVSTEPVNVLDTERFRKAWDHPRKRHMISRVIALEVGSEIFNSFFTESV